MREINDDDKIKQLLSNDSNILLNSNDIFLIAKYFRNLGNGENGIRKNIFFLLSEKYKNYNIILNRIIINTAIKTALRNSEMRNFKEMWITQNEVNRIKEFKDIKLQKILFSIIVFCRSESRNILSHFELKKILSFSGTKTSYGVFEKKYLKLLTENKFLFYDEYATQKKSGIEGGYKVNLPVIQGDEKISIESYSEVMQSGWIWKMFIGRIDYCRICGNEFEKESNGHKTCKRCSLEKRKVDIRENVRRFRNSKKM